MISYFWGADREGSRRAARDEFAKQREMSPNSPVFEFTSDNASLLNLEEVLCARTLGGEPVIVFGDHLFGNSLLTNFLIENSLALQSSVNHFIFWEDELAASIVGKIIKAGEGAREFKVAFSPKLAESKAELMKLFALADALGSRDRKRAWLLYHEARRDGTAPEEVFWKLVWKVKTLLLVEVSSAESVLPLKPYPLSQARRQVKNYKSGELPRLSSRLVHLYHDSRRGLIDFDLNLERLILEL
ncbi:MAG: hypothetical protein AAB415_02900 [Patescibacteria group bacterium]